MADVWWRYGFHALRVYLRSTGDTDMTRIMVGDAIERLQRGCRTARFRLLYQLRASPYWGLRSYQRVAETHDTRLDADV